MAGKEVGRITIRVMPDTEQFFRDLREMLVEAEKLHCTVKVHADTTKFKEQILAAAKGLNPEVDVDANADAAKLRDEIDAATRGLDGVVDLDADADEVETKVNKATRDRKVKVGADTKPAEKALDRWQRRYLGKINALLDNIDIASKLTPEGEIDRQGFDRQLKGLRKRVIALDLKADPADLADLRYDIDEVYRYLSNAAADVDLIPKNSTADVNRLIKRLSGLKQFQVDLIVNEILLDKELASAKAGLEKLEFTLRPQLDGNAFQRQYEFLKIKYLKERVVVNLDIDRNRFQKAFGGAFAETANATRLGFALASAAVQGAADGFSVLATGAKSALNSISSIPQWLILTAAVSAILAPALALVTGALVALPGVIAGVAAPIGVIALGMDGIKKAAEAAKPAFDNLKTAISGVFEQGLTDSFEKINGFIPQIQGQLSGLAGMMSSSFAGVIDTLTSGAGLETVRGIINDITTAVQRAAPGMQSFTNGLLNLTKGVTGTFLQDIATGFSNIGKEFDAWVTKVSNNGQLQTAMGTLKTVLGEIGGIIKDIASFSFDALVDPQFADSMKGFVADLRTIVGVLLPAFKAGFETIANVIEPIADTINAIKDAMSGIGDFLGKIPGLSALNKALNGGGGSAYDRAKTMWNALTGNMPKDVTEAGQKAGEGLSKGLGAGIESSKAQIQAAINSAGSAVETGQFGGGTENSGIGQALSGQVDTAISAAKGRLAAFQGEFGGMIDTALQPLQTIGQKVSDAFSTAAGTVATSFAPIVTTIGTGATQINAAITASLANLPLAFMTAFNGINSTVTGAFGSVVQTVATGASQINSAVASSLSNLPSVVMSAMSGIAGVVAGGLAQAAGAAVTGAGQIVQGVLAGITPVLGVVQQIFAAIPGVIQGQMGAAVGAVSAGCSQMVSTALSFAGGMEAAGATIGASFARGIASQTGLVASAAGALMAAARALIPSSPAKEGPFSGRGWVTYSGESVGKGFAQGMQNSTGDVVSTARELMQAVKDIFGSAEGLTLNFNMGPVTQQLGEAQKAVSTFQSSLASTANTATGFADSVNAPGVTGMSAAEAEDKKTALDMSMRQLEMERKSLEIQKAQGAGDQAAIKARLEEIKQQKLQLGLQQNQLAYAEKYGDQVDSSGGKLDQIYKDIGKKVVGLPTDFAKATGQQFMQDLGMSGNGMIPQLLEQGSQYIFQVANMDTALAGHQRIQNQQSLGLVGR